MEMDGKKWPTQREIDEIRYRVWLHLMRSMLDNRDPNAVRPPMYHLWFPENDLRVYCIRLGNPPSDRDRPSFLRGLRLELDVQDIPHWLREIMRPHGQLDDMLESAGREYLETNEELPPDVAHKLRIALFDRVAKKFADKGLE